MYEREDWTMFRSLATLGQRAGVSQERLPALVAKELVDNALDTGAPVQVSLEGETLIVEDAGDGIPGTSEEIARLFSIARPLTSSKLLRLPTRGALGNGLRVVAGAVLATRGALRVHTRGRSLELCPQDDGTTTARVLQPCSRVGTRVDVELGAPLTFREEHLLWGENAILLAEGGQEYKGKTSAHWYDADTFFELCQAAAGRSVRELVAEFDGCSGRKAGQIAAAYLNRLAVSLTRDEATALLTANRANSRPVEPGRLGYVGKREAWGYYKREIGMVDLRTRHHLPTATIPFAVEVWAELTDEASVYVAVNRSPIAARMIADYRKSNDLILFGCGLHRSFSVGRKPVSLIINIITPYMPITTDGKEPDLKPFLGSIVTAAEGAIRKAKRDAQGNGTQRVSQKQVVIAFLDTAMAKASGEWRYRYSLRQLYYVLRPLVAQYTGAELGYDWFSKVITEYENEQGRDLRMLYRDERGSLYHPHTGETYSLGTLTAESYARPSWTFNKVLYCEKEGFFQVLQDEQWPERHDCALLTSKGFATRAAKDVLDIMGHSDEPLQFFCIHDADADGTTIYQSLQEGTAARPGRQVQIINLGLDAWEAIEMGLEVEEFKPSKLRPVADYVPGEYVRWLQSHRVELNAMSSPQFIAWLDRKMEEHGAGKMIPPAPVQQAALEDALEQEARERIQARILEEHDFEGQVTQAVDEMALLGGEAADALDAIVRHALTEDPAQQWRTPIMEQARQIADEHERAA